MSSTSSYGLTYFINFITLCFFIFFQKKRHSLRGGYASLGLGPFNLPNRRNLIVGTLLTFLSRGGVEVKRAETNVNQQSGETKEQTCVGAGDGGWRERGSQQWRQFRRSRRTLKATECIARPRPASVFCSKYLWFFFLPTCLVCTYYAY